MLLLYLCLYAKLLYKKKRGRRRKGDKKGREERERWEGREGGKEREGGEREKEGGKEGDKTSRSQDVQPWCTTVYLLMSTVLLSTVPLPVLP